MNKFTIGQMRPVSPSSLLREYKAPHVRVLGSKPPLWAKVERLPSDDILTFKKFVRRYRAARDADLLQSLLDFADRTAIFLKIGDISGDNLVYSKSRREWIVLDWWPDHELWNYRSFRPDRVKNDTLFSEIFVGEGMTQDENLERILSERVTETRIRYFAARSKKKSLKFVDWSCTRLFQDAF